MEQQPMDAFEQPQPLGPRQPKPPWSPRAIGVMSFCFSFLPAGIMLGLNFARLGRPERTWPTIGGVIAGFALFVIAIVYVPDHPVLNQVFGAINFGVAYFFYQSQKQLFEEHIKNGGSKASPWAAAFLSLLLIVTLGGGVFGYYYYDTVEDEERFRTATEYLDTGRYAEAEQMFLEYQEKYPEEYNALWNLGLVYENTKQYDKAIAAFSEYLEMQPEDPQGHNRIDHIRFKQSIVLLQDKNYKQAEPLLKALAEKMPDHPDTLWNLSLVYIGTDQLEQARQTLLACQKLAPDDPEVTNQLEAVEQRILREADH